MGVGDHPENVVGAIRNKMSREVLGGTLRAVYCSTDSAHIRIIVTSTLTSPLPVEDKEKSPIFMLNMAGGYWFMYYYVQLL